MRATALVPLVLVATLLAACSSSDPERSPAASDAPSTTVSAPSPTASAGATIAPGGDPYCEPALAGYEALDDLLDATDRKSEQTGVEDNGGDVAVMNAAGEEMLAANAVVRDEWTQAQAVVDTPQAPSGEGYSTEEVTDAFAAVLDHLDAWVEPEAAIAADASSMEEYDAATVALLQDEAVVEAAARSGEGLSVVLGYTLMRCGQLPSP